MCLTTSVRSRYTRLERRAVRKLCFRRVASALLRRAAVGLGLTKTLFLSVLICWLFPTAVPAGWSFLLGGRIIDEYLWERVFVDCRLSRVNLCRRSRLAVRLLADSLTSDFDLLTVSSLLSFGALSPRDSVPMRPDLPPVESTGVLSPMRVPIREVLSKPGRLDELMADCSLVPEILGIEGL